MAYHPSYTKGYISLEKHLQFIDNHLQLIIVII